jgi:sulfate transport system ATP-binding protein
MAIVARSVTKRFGQFVALDDASIEVPSGSLTALLGPSSAVNEPDGTSIEASSSATNSPNLFVTDLATMAI